MTTIEECKNSYTEKQSGNNLVPEERKTTKSRGPTNPSNRLSRFKFIFYQSFKKYH